MINRLTALMYTQIYKMFVDLHCKGNIETGTLGALIEYSCFRPMMIVVKADRSHTTACMTEQKSINFFYIKIHQCRPVENFLDRTEHHPNYFSQYPEMIKC